MDTNGQTAGDYSADFIVSGDDPNNASDTVTVNWTLNDPPVVGANPDTFDVTLAPGDSIEQTLTIINSGNGPLDFEIAFEDLTTKRRPVAKAHSKKAWKRPAADLSDDAQHPGVVIDETPKGYALYHHNSISQTPELMFYRFNEAGQTQTQNFSPANTRVNEFATLQGALTMGGSGASGSALVGASGSSSIDFVDTQWGTALNGDWAISFWIDLDVNSTVLRYMAGDVNAGAFRIFLRRICWSW